VGQQMDINSQLYLLQTLLPHFSLLSIEMFSDLLSRAKPPDFDENLKSISPSRNGWDP
jgi:hypothetical protein